MSDETRPGDDLEPIKPSDDVARRADPMPDPGLPEHQWRPTDVDPAQEKRAERQVSGMFLLAGAMFLAFCVAYFAVPADATFLGWSALNFALGATLGTGLLLIGTGAIQWAKKLMKDHEIVEMRHPAASSTEDRAETLQALNDGIDESGFGRRPMIRNSLFAAFGLLALPSIVLLRDLGPLPGRKQFETVWAEGMRVVIDVAGSPIRPQDMRVGDLINAQPQIFFEEVDGEGPIAGHDLLVEKAKASVIVVRIAPEDLQIEAGRENWQVDGILCYSKICTHVGCPISLWEQQTHHLLCPCHQTTYDLADNGKVIFGPAHRRLPQLPLFVDSEGYLAAREGFTEPVGPSFPEVHQDS